MTLEDPYRLERFVSAQNGGTFEAALDELKAGRKTGHWIWFVFPQIAGLGSSSTSEYFALSSLEEAGAYLAHPLLGPRLVECAQALLQLEGVSAEQVLGSLDALKLRSSMTLFLRASPDKALFARVLERYFAGQADPATDARV
ncbi:MAG: DUF1810 domain-containing protein [Acidimicrobiales bacterium]|jgi:uncharacterized protein (DUF1810 family)